MSRYHIATKPTRFPPHEKVTPLLIPSSITRASWKDVFNQIRTVGYITSTDAVLSSFTNEEAPTGTYKEYNPEVQARYNYRNYWKKKLARELELYGDDNE